MDGQQRLLSVAYFFSGTFGIKKDDPLFNLVALSEKSKFSGKTYYQLKDENQEAYNKLINSVMRSFVVKQLDPQDDTSIFEMFNRLNTGGVSLTPQEIRNCIYQYPLNDLITELNKYEPWRHIVGGAEDKRMRDSELILRFMALRWGPKYTKPMKRFLNTFMEDHKKATLQDLNAFAEEFKKTADAVLLVLGGKPFHIRRGLNAAVYDSVFTAFSKHLDTLNKPAQKIRKQIAARFKHLITKDKEYEDWTISATTDQEVVIKRINLADEFLFS